MGTTAQKLQSIVDSKADIKSALTTMGRTPSDLLRTYGDEIRAIKAGDQINNAKEVSVVAKDKIKIGDTVYTVDGVKDLYADTGTTVLSNAVFTAAFSPDGKTLVLGGNFTGRAKVYSVSGNTITFVSNIYADAGTTALNGHVDTAAFSPDGKTLVLGGYFSGRAKVYSVSGTTITYVSDIYANAGTTALSNVVRTAAFSPDGKTLVLGGWFTGYAKVYSVSGTTITFVSDIYADARTTALDDYVSTAAFSPDGKTLVLGGYFTGCAKVYSVSGTTITFVSNIYADTGTTALSNTVGTAAFSPDGTTLVLGGGFDGRAKVYSVSGTTITYVSNIYADTGTTVLSSAVYTATFSPNGTTLVLGGYFSGRAKVYSVSGTTITFVSDIYADTGTTVLSNTVRTAAFSPDGKTLVLGGDFDGRAKVYPCLPSADHTFIKYGFDLYSDTGTTALSDTVETAAFSPDGTTLILSGWFTGRAKVYSVSGTTITFVSNIYADTGTTALSNTVLTAAFSPDGKTLVLGGWFTGYAKVYSVSGTTITYVSNIYANAGTTALSNAVQTATFSPDGKTLVLGGSFNGRAKVYSVSGTKITFVSNIYADTGATLLSDTIHTAAFSPDGTTLVLGGWFTGYAKVYSVSGTTIAYISDIYADAGTTALSDCVYTAAFSPDGTTLILGGIFNGCAKVYSVSGTTIAYISDIYADAGTTVLSHYVKTAAFSPDGKTLVLGGNFTGRAKAYLHTALQIPENRNLAYLAEGGTISLEAPFDHGVGYALEDLEAEAVGTVKTIGRVVGMDEPWAGNGDKTVVGNVEIGMYGMGFYYSDGENVCTCADSRQITVQKNSLINFDTSGRGFTISGGAVESSDYPGWFLITGDFDVSWR